MQTTFHIVHGNLHINHVKSVYPLATGGNGKNRFDQHTMLCTVHLYCTLHFILHLVGLNNIYHYNAVTDKNNHGTITTIKLILSKPLSVRVNNSETYIYLRFRHLS